MKIIKKVFIIFFLLFLTCIDGNNVNGPVFEDNSYLIFEAEDYTEGSDLIRLEESQNASQNTCVHIGPDSDVESEGIGQNLYFEFDLPVCFPMGIFEICYSDDVGGNIIHVFLDDKKKGSFRTESTGGWHNFVIDWQKINLGYLDEGSHTIKLEITKGGSWGVHLDYFKVTNCELMDKINGSYNFVRSLINENTGLVDGSDYDKNFTTIYKNSLAAMVFIHEGDLNLAEGIFDFFNSKYSSGSFAGFNKNWDPETGNEGQEDHWVGDNAFLLLALNYYRETTGSFDGYEEMAEGLVKWLCESASGDIIAEGLANMYAALKPFEDSIEGVDTVLPKLEEWFNSNKDFQNVLDHIERAALCFSDSSGFDYINSYKRNEIWDYNGEYVHLLSAFYHEHFVNVEISTQILLAWEIWQQDLSVNLSYLETEIDKIWLLGSSSPDTVSYGLPYFLSSVEWDYACDGAIIDPVCYMLFYYWGFNPMAPGKKGY